MVAWRGYAGASFRLCDEPRCVRCSTPTQNRGLHASRTRGESGTTTHLRASRHTGTATAALAGRLQIDGDLDSDVVFHEYGHGLSWRMIGDMGGVLSGAIGEGASEILRMLIAKDLIRGG